MCFGFLAEREICGKFTIITACTYNKIQGIYMHPESSHKYIDLVIFISATTISMSVTQNPLLNKCPRISLFHVFNYFELGQRR